MAVCEANVLFVCFLDRIEAYADGRCVCKVSRVGSLKCLTGGGENVRVGDLRPPQGSLIVIPCPLLPARSNRRV